jgi:hypothetical protein
LSGVERWNVAPDMIVRMDVRPHGKILVQSLHLDRTKYPRLQEGHPENWARYTHNDDGVMVENHIVWEGRGGLYRHLLAEIRG